MLSDFGAVSVDTKRNLNELSRNLLNRNDHSRFWRELRRAKEKEIKLVILVEHGAGIKCIQDVAKWKDPYSGVTGKRLMQEIYRVHISYGVEFLFCDKRSTGKVLLDILTKK